MKAATSRRAAPPERRAPATPQGNEAGDLTRIKIIKAGERLFAETGVGVSTREIGKAAGQSNTSAVAYHFGTRNDLVRAIARYHAPDIEQRRDAMVAALSNPNSKALGDWLGCIVKPITDHLASLGSPTWYARFLACTTTDPALRAVVFNDAITSASMRTMLDEVNKRLPALPPDVFEARGFMSQHLIVNACADHERALQTRRRTPFSSWRGVCEVTVDALLGLWMAPVRSAEVSGSRVTSRKTVHPERSARLTRTAAQRVSPGTVHPERSARLT